MPNASGPPVAGVRDLLAVLGAVAGVVEARVGREDPGVERGRRGDGLERRARRIEALGRAVVERRRRTRARRTASGGCSRTPCSTRSCSGRKPGDDAIDIDLARLRVEHDRGAALALEQVLGEPLGVRADVQHEVVARDRRALQGVPELVEDRAEIRVRGRQVRVLRALDAGARAALRRVADRLRGEPVRRVACGSRASPRPPSGGGSRRAPCRSRRGSGRA